MSSALSNLASKFAMKLGLESRPSSSMPGSQEETPSAINEEDFESNPFEREFADSSQETMNYLGSQEFNEIRHRIKTIRVNMQTVEKYVEFADYENSLHFVKNAFHELMELQSALQMARERQVEFEDSL